MKYYVTIRRSIESASQKKYLRGGAKMYTDKISEAQLFRTREAAEDAAESVRKLMNMLPLSRRWVVGVMQRSGGGR